MVDLALEGWEPVPSGDGMFLYWCKDDKYRNDLPFFYHTKSAVAIVDSTSFWNEVKRRMIHYYDTAKGRPLCYTDGDTATFSIADWPDVTCRRCLNLKPKEDAVLSRRYKGLYWKINAEEFLGFAAGSLVAIDYKSGGGFAGLPEELWLAPVGCIAKPEDKQRLRPEKFPLPCSSVEYHFGGRSIANYAYFDERKAG
jgi:hypothetical protein